MEKIVDCVLLAFINICHAFSKILWWSSMNPGLSVEFWGFQSLLSWTQQSTLTQHVLVTHPPNSPCSPEWSKILTHTSQVLKEACRLNCQVLQIMKKRGLKAKHVAHVSLFKGSFLGSCANFALWIWRSTHKVRSISVRHNLQLRVVEEQPQEATS